MENLVTNMVSYV